MMGKIIIVNNKENIFAQIDKEILTKSNFKVEFFHSETSFKWLFKNFFSLIKKIKSSQLVFAWWAKNFLPFFIAKILNKRSILIAGGGHIIVDDNLKGIYPKVYNSQPFFWKILIKKSLTYADIVVVPSEFCRKNVLKIKPDIKDKIRVVYNCVNLGEFNIIPSGKYVPKFIGTTCFLYKYALYTKGLNYLFQAVKTIYEYLKEKGIKVMIIGNDKGGKKSIIRYVKELKIEDLIVFKNYDFKTKREYAEFIKKNFLIYIQPSIVETFGMAMVEAMACGIPVIASSGGALPEVLKKSGIVVNIKDVKDFSRALITLMEDREKREKLGNLAKKVVSENYSCEKRREKLESIINSLMKDVKKDN